VVVPGRFSIGRTRRVRRHDPGPGPRVPAQPRRCRAGRTRRRCIFGLRIRIKFEVGFEPGGALAYAVRDEEGRPLPAKVGLYRDGNLVQTIYCVSGSGEAPVVPGSYEVSVTRGFEYVPHEGTVEVLPGRTARVEATLVHAVDTSGFMSADMHLHAGPSGDNKITIAERIVTAAAEGLEVAVSTDHEAIISWKPGIEETGLSAWVATVLGEEVTATVPEHTNMFPAAERFDLDAA